MLRLVTVIICGAICGPALADWPAFLGGVQRSKNQFDLPVAWSDSANIRWHKSLKGYGQSSPVVIANRIYLTAVEGPNKEKNLVLCHDLKSGEHLWTHELASSIQVKNDRYTSRAAPTVAADRNGVYAFFESGDVVALTPDGKVRWERNLVEDYTMYKGRFGLGGSVAQFDDRIFILADNEGPSYLLSLSKSTGKTLWKTDRESRVSWSSPMIVSVGGTRQVVVSSAGSVDGYTTDGELLWTLTDVGGNTVASPVPFGDGMFLVGASPSRTGENSDSARRSNMAVKIEKQGEKFVPMVLWRNEKASSSFGSPIVHDGNAYYVNRTGVLFCIDSLTGELRYTARMKQSVWATPIGIDERLYFFGQRGTTTVIAQGSKYKEIAVNQLWASGSSPAKSEGRSGAFDPIQYGVALTPDGFLIRTGTSIYLVAK